MSNKKKCEELFLRLKKFTSENPKYSIKGKDEIHPELLSIVGEWNANNCWLDIKQHILNNTKSKDSKKKLTSMENDELVAVLKLSDLKRSASIKKNLRKSKKKSSRKSKKKSSRKLIFKKY